MAQPEPVTLRVYDVGKVPALIRANHLLRAVGTGAFHAAVEVYGSEYSYGYTDEGTGVFGCLPEEAEEVYEFREAIPMGHTNLTEDELMQLLGEMADEWPGDEYDLLSRNCTHFSDALCKRLGFDGIPGWVMNLAGAGASLQHGVEVVATTVGAAAVVAAAKAGEIDEKYDISGKTQALAKELLLKAGEVDQKYKIKDQARGAGKKVMKDVIKFTKKHNIHGKICTVAVKVDKALDLQGKVGGAAERFPCLAGCAAGFEALMRNASKVCSKA